MFHPMFMVPCPEAPLTPSPLTIVPAPKKPSKCACTYIIMMFHPMFMVPCPKAPLTPSPLTPCPRNPKGVLAPTHHDVPFYVHGPVPRGPPNPKSPDPLSQPPRNPKGVLVPKHHDVPPTHHFFLFCKGCTATSDGILASHLWLLQVTEFLVSQVTCHPWLPYIHDFRGIFLQVAPATGHFRWLLSCFGCFFSEDPWHCGSLLLKPSWQRTWAVFGPHRKTSPGFWDLISHTLLNTFTWYTLIYCNQRKFRLRNFRYTNNISVKLSQVEQVK